MQIPSLFAVLALALASFTAAGPVASPQVPALPAVTEPPTQEAPKCGDMWDTGSMFGSTPVAGGGKICQPLARKGETPGPDSRYNFKMYSECTQCTFYEKKSEDGTCEGTSTTERYVDKKGEWRIEFKKRQFNFFQC